MIIKKRYLSLFLLVFIAYLSAGPHCSAQFENVWVFGQAGLGLDFNHASPKPFSSAITGTPLLEGCAAVCDRSGQLLFYATGDSIWDRNHQIMSNGDGLTGLPNQGLYTPCSSTSQGVLIVPFVGDQYLYYVFSLTHVTRTDAAALYYSVVDLRLNNGKGAVVPGRKGILLDSLLTEKMTAVIGDQCNVWLLLHAQHPSLDFRVWEITENGIGAAPVISSVGNQDMVYNHGTLNVAPNRKQLVASNNNSILHSGLELYDFDPGSGIVRNLTPLGDWRDGIFYTSCFSPDNSKLYATIQYELFQYDLTKPEPKNTKISLGKCSGFGIKCGPDGKIYVMDSYIEPYSVAVIENPNTAGLNCNYKNDYITLLPRTDHGTSNAFAAGFPNVVAVITHDTFYTTTTLKAPCFANVQGIQLEPANLMNGWGYLWQDGDSAILKTAKYPGKYWVSYYSPPCNFHIDTFQVFFPNGVLPDLHLQQSCPNIANGTAWLSTYPGDTVSYHYTWQNSSGDTLSLKDSLLEVPSGDYLLSVHTLHCDTTISFLLSEVTAKASFMADSVFCQGTAMPFQNTADPYFTTYQWDMGDSTIFNSKEVEHSFKDVGLYTVILTGIGPLCTDTFRKLIVVDSMYRGIFSVDRSSICTGEQVYFNAGPVQNSRWQTWDFGDGTQRKTMVAESVRHAYAVPGVQSVVLHTQFRACPETHYETLIDVAALPLVDLGPDSSLCWHGTPIFLENKLPDSSPMNYSWNTGDTTAQIKVIHPGLYSLTLRAQSTGCSTTESIVISKDCYIDMPNVFTPNDDGVNDYFFPRQLLSSSISMFKMQVYNRWGLLVFETEQVQGSGWDGRFNGQRQPEGVYLYHIQVGLSKEITEYRGNVTLLR